MKKILLIVLMLLFAASTCFAEKNEWIDKDFDFTKCKRVIVFYDLNKELCDGVLELESRDTVVKNGKSLREFMDKRHSVVHFFSDTSDLADIEAKASQYHNINLSEIDKTDHQKSANYLLDYIRTHYDTLINITLRQYGYSKTYLESSYYERGGIKDVPQCSVYFGIADFKTDKDIWRRIDSRAAVNDGFTDKSPKGMFGRIINSFFEDFKNKIEPSSPF